MIVASKKKLDASFFFLFVFRAFLWEGEVTLKVNFRVYPYAYSSVMLFHQLSDQLLIQLAVLWNIYDVKGISDTEFDKENLTVNKM